MIALPRILPGESFSWAYAINDAGQIVGHSGSGPQCCWRDRAVIWTGSVIADLNDLIPPDSGWVLTMATGINDAGQIVGQGTIGGQTHAFLLTPNK
jgi:probable HAF family extracellular repeat protein